MYDVALSFAGEDRGLAEQIAVLCKSTGMTVYYDGFERSSMWGKDLPSHLDTIYQKNAHYCIVLISEAYARKPWTRLEIRSALARAMEDPDTEYLLPVRIDDTDVPGLPRTISYLDARVLTPEDIVNLLSEKVGARAEPAFNQIAANALHAATEAAYHSTGVHALVGMTVFDRYRLQRLIAAGGMGELWEGVDSRSGSRVAIKVLGSEFGANEGFVGQFRAAAEMVNDLNLRHPGIADVYEAGATEIDGVGSTGCVVSELIDGESLNSVLKREGRLPLDYALNILEQSGRALQAAHAEAFMHLDIKPSNILITPLGKVKLTDFFLGWIFDSAELPRRDVMVTALYISPEQALGRDQATASSDVYSLGVVGYELISGLQPFTGDGALTVAMKHIKETPPTLHADVPPNVRELVEISLAKDPSMRYSSGGQFAEAVAAVRAGRRPPPPSSGPSPTA